MGCLHLYSVGPSKIADLCAGAADVDFGSHIPGPSCQGQTQTVDGWDVVWVQTVVIQAVENDGHTRAPVNPERVGEAVENLE